MSARASVKIVICGPTKGGKTSIANFIAGHTEQLGNVNRIYEPTVGTRYRKIVAVRDHFSLV